MAGKWRNERMTLPDIELKKLSRWIRQEIEEIKYGEIGIKFILHDGQLRKIDKVVKKSERIRC